MKKLNLILFMLLGLHLIVPAQEEIDKAFPFPKGSIKFTRDHFKMDYVKSTEVKNDTLRFINAGKKPVTFTIQFPQPYITYKIEPNPVLPGQRGTVILSLDAARKGDFGNSYDGLNLYSDDSLEPQKYFFLMSYIEEDFSMLSPEQMDNAPMISFATEVYKFGKIASGKKISYSFEFTNKGKNDLIIRKTKASCGCTTTALKKYVIKPGESGFVDIIFDSTNQKGPQHKSVFVYSNDPRYSAATLTLEGEVY